VDPAGFTKPHRVLRRAKGERRSLKNEKNYVIMHIKLRLIADPSGISIAL
jgi:hypothetical protein